MAQKPEIVRTKNEATGIRVVSQYVTEFWECGWQSIDQINDKGIDGLIIMRKGGKDIGIDINVQVKCGINYISSQSKEEFRISISNDLLGHIEYWKKQLLPTILVFVVPQIPVRDIHGNIMHEIKLDKNNIPQKKIMWKESRINSQAYWLDIKDENAFDKDYKTIIKIDKKNRFGEHSKGGFLKLIEPYLSTVTFQKIILNSENSKLLYSENLREDSRKFYKEWKLTNKGHFSCKALKNKNIIISRTGWNHITNKSRGKDRRNISLKLLGAGKQIIEEVEKYFLLQQIDKGDFIEQKLGLRGIVKTKYDGEKVIQVVILRRFNKSTNYNKYWFYSIHHRQ